MCLELKSAFKKYLGTSVSENSAVIQELLLAMCLPKLAADVRLFLHQKALGLSRLTSIKESAKDILVASHLLTGQWFRLLPFDANNVS